MRIALLTFAVPWCDRPTNGLYNIAQCRALKDLGHEAIVLSCAPMLPRALARFSPLIARQCRRHEHNTVDGVDVYTLRTFFGYNRWIRESISRRFPNFIQWWFHRSAKKQLGRWLDQYKPSALVIHGVFPWGRFAVQYAESRSIPVIAIEHSRTDLDKLQDSNAYKETYRSLSSKCKRVFTVSGKMTDQLRDIGLKNVSTILNGIQQFPCQTSHPRTRRAENLGVKFKILVAGQYIKRKGHRYIFEALTDPRLADVGITLIGKPPSQFRNEVLRLRTSNRIQILPLLSQSELRKEMAQADLFVLPSWGEAFGLVYLESISAGTPVVLSDDSGASELDCVRNAGWIVPPRNSNAIADAICSAMKFDEYLLDESVSQSSDWIRNHATWIRNAGMIIQSLSQLK